MPQTHTPLIHGLRGTEPVISSSAWIAPLAVVIGDVEIGPDCTVWYHAVLRGDVGSIRMGRAVNIQDGAMVHSTFGLSKVVLEDEASVGHRAIIHGCHVGKRCLIGMGAVVMDNVVVEEGAVVAAGAVVLAGTRIPSGTIWAGVPAKQVKAMDAEELAKRSALTAKAYVKYATWYQDQMLEG